MFAKRLPWICLPLFIGLVTIQATQPQQPEPAKQKDQPSDSRNVAAQQPVIPAKSKIYIAPMGGFEDDLKTAMTTKKVPVLLVDRRENAEFEITGVAESKKAGAAKILIMGSFHSTEDASIKVSNLKTGEIVYAYSVHKENSTHGKKSSAEACAKHLKDEAVLPK
jgi:hypothetical protein